MLLAAIRHSALTSPTVQQAFGFCARKSLKTRFFIFSEIMQLIKQIVVNVVLHCYAYVAWLSKQSQTLQLSLVKVWLSKYVLIWHFVVSEISVWVLFKLLLPLSQAGINMSS